MFFFFVPGPVSSLFGVEETVADNELFRSNCRKPDETVRKTAAMPVPKAILYQKPPVKTKILKKNLNKL